MTAQKQISTVTQKSQVTTKVVSGLKCPDCREKQVTIKVIRGVIVAGSAKCSACGWSVRVARLNDGVIGKCPCCGSFAFPALGWRSGKQPFVALSCDQCGWVASETYMQAVGILLSVDIYAATNQADKGQSDQVRRKDNRTIDGVPAAYEAALPFAVKALSPVLGLLPVNQDGAGRKVKGINLALFDRLHQPRRANL
jgi:transcription elongation factor Elf1